jgi:hypothetical protein
MEVYRITLMIMRMDSSTNSMMRLTVRRTLIVVIMVKLRTQNMMERKLKSQLLIAPYRRMLDQLRLIKNYKNVAKLSAMVQMFLSLILNRILLSKHE